MGNDTKKRERLVMDFDAQSRARTVSSVAIIHYRFNHLLIRNIISLTKCYVDKVYVVLNRQNDEISGLARSLGATVINVTKDRPPNMVNAIRSDCEATVFIFLYGDGTHNPDRIPELITCVEQGYDVVVDVSRDDNVRVKESIRILNNRQVEKSGEGFIAFSSTCLDTFTSFSKKGNISAQMLTNAQYNGLNIKYLDVDTPMFALFNDYNIGVVVPAYNEASHIGATVAGIPRYVSRIYIIDDASTDLTPIFIKGMPDPRIVSVRHVKNAGVGATIVTGYKLALEDGMDLVAVMDGDNQMDPGQLPRLLIPIIEGRADYTKGNRLINKKFRKGMSSWRFLGNCVLTTLTKIASGYWNITDSQNGYTVISRRALESLDLESIYAYYGYCNDLLVKLNAVGMRAIDVPIPARYGTERSHIKYSKYILKVAPMLFRRFMWRLAEKYLVFGFNPLIFLYIFGMGTVATGALLSMGSLVRAMLHMTCPLEFLVLAAVMLLVGLPFLFLAMLFDMQATKSRYTATAEL